MLLKSNNGLALVQHVLERVQGRVKTCAYDKLLALAGKFFEYIYEPVLQADPGVAYQRGLHRFVAMFGYLFFTEGDERGAEAMRQFETYMRTLDASRAPLLFAGPPVRPEEADDPFAAVLTFSRACRARIVSDNALAERHTPDNGKWILDLAISSLWSLLDDWGAEGLPIRVVCDDSKPLRAQAPNFVTEQLAFAQARVAELLPDRHRNGFQLAGGVEFADSRGTPALQIADIAAGALAKVLGETTRRDEAPLREDLRPIAELILPSMSRHSVMPDYGLIDIGSRGPAINWATLGHMATVAAEGGDPCEGLDDWYRVADAAYDRGDFASIMDGEA